MPGSAIPYESSRFIDFRTKTAAPLEGNDYSWKHIRSIAQQLREEKGNDLCDMDILYLAGNICGALDYIHCLIMDLENLCNPTPLSSPATFESTLLHERVPEDFSKFHGDDHLADMKNNTAIYQAATKEKQGPALLEEDVRILHSRLASDLKKFQNRWARCLPAFLNEYNRLLGMAHTRCIKMEKIFAEAERKRLQLGVTLRSLLDVFLVLHEIFLWFLYLLHAL
ncbi:hypothetical protein BGZ96_001978 [Linnemannia gamsii]|uniref:Uncharacterized protein n=1 Tax=Linnemannia gamsii TaxID=64522 RepID=A0ABQ7JLK7_9FUNG|nr:hypothetical protein BGZ96_001978 [Linnemannia gamsii]